MNNRKLAIAVTAAATVGLLAGISAPEFELDQAEKHLEGVHTGKAKVVGARKDGTGGEVGEVKVRIEPGSGKVLVATQPYMKTNTQASAKLAKNLAESYTGVTLEDENVVYSFKISTGVIGGPSAGAAMTLATIAAITDKKVRKDAVITGTVTRRGEIGKVGSVLTKARTAGKAGMDTFYVPEGQVTRVNYQRVLDTEREGFFIYRDVEYRRQVFNISEYTLERFKMPTREVETVSKAARLMLKS